MRKFLSTLLSTLLVTLTGNAAGLNFDSAAAALRYEAAASTGLSGIYVLKSTAGVNVSAPGATKFRLFGSAGAAYAEDTPVTVLPAGSTGVIMTDDTGRDYYFWVVDYSEHALQLNQLSAPPDMQESCGRTTLVLDGEAAAIPVYTINGRRDELSRELHLSFNTLQFDEESFTYQPVHKEEILDGMKHIDGVEAPLCDTEFTLSGDRFLRAWGGTQSVSTLLVPTTAVEAETRAVQTEHEADNEQKDGSEGEGSTLGGSAPCEISFEAIVSDAVVFRQWQISKYADFDIVENTYDSTDFTYTFTENGTVYVRFTADNDRGDCEFVGTVYQVSIGESRLDIPNAFSPNSSPGVNDEWKVSYRSIVEFECHIFNRWGTRLCSFTDPAMGWDGKYKGKPVPAGTYYYVIKARGADGVDYKKAGDINIVDLHGGTSAVPGDEDAPESELE